jgi:uncharacterized protein (TIGR02231 family)
MHPTRLVFLAVSSFGFASALGAAPTPVDSRVSTATVYVDRAIVTRTATVALEAGSQQLVFPGLPASLDADLLQVSGNGTAAATILDVRAESAQLEAAANPRLAALLEQARSIQSELRVVDDRTTVVQQQRDYLDKIKTATVTPPTAEGSQLPNMAQWQQLLEFYAQGLGRSLTEQQDLDRQREDIRARLAAVQREIKELQAPGRREVKNVVVRIDVAEAGDLDLQLAYTVYEASWSPTYDVRVNSADKAIVLGYAAMVRQSTGEDWPGVQLVLSTARPALGGTPPELSPWYVREQQPQYRAGSTLSGARTRSAPAVAEDAVALEAFSVGAEPRDKREATFSAAQVETGLTAATFTIPYAATVPADNAEHKVSIASHPLTGDLSHLAVPKLAELAYLRAAVKNSTGAPLMGGPVNLFLDGTYVARSQLATVMPDEAFDLDLGVDDSIKIERKLVNRLRENTGLISRNQRVTYDWLITVTNNSRAAQKIVVRDQIPVSQHEKIVVRLVAPPASEVERTPDGRLTWTLDLPAGEKRELPLRLSVEHPADMSVEGLE